MTDSRVALDEQIRTVVRDELTGLGLLRPDTLGNRIREARVARGLSQRDLAGLFGCSQATIQSIEDGTRGVLLRRLDDLAELLGKRIVLIDITEGS